MYLLGGLHQAEGSAGLKEGDHRHLALRLLHRVQLPNLPGRRRLAAAAPRALCLPSALGEQAESQGQDQPLPHGLRSLLSGRVAGHTDRKGGWGLGRVRGGGLAVIITMQRD